MSEERKKRGWAFWTVIALVLTAACPLSIVPVAWLVEHDILPKAAIDYWVVVFYISAPAIFTSVFIWLVVQVMNRRDRWAKWSLAAMLSMPILYVASWPPVARLSTWLDSHGFFPDALQGVLAIVYYPAGMTVNGPAPAWLRNAMIWYLGIWFT